MTQNREEELQKLVDISAEMLQRAESREWVALSRMINDRYSRMELFFSDPVSPELSALVRNGIHSIQEVDARITALINGASQQTAKQQSALQQRRKISRIYSDPHNPPDH